MLDVYCTSPEIAAAKPTMAVVGVGAIEQHGRHLPVATDWSGVTDMSRRVAEQLGAFWIPAIPFSMSECHGEMAGTVWLNPDTLAKVVRDIVLSLHMQGIHQIVIMNGHGGNFILEPTIQELNLEHPSLTVIMPGHAAPPDPPIFESRGEIHAGEGETSSQLALNPELVKDERVDYLPPVGREFLDYAVMSKLSPEGIWGNPSFGTIEKGLRAREHAVAQTVHTIRQTFATIDQLKQSSANAGGNHV
jgi:creatinine amidohydrolase